MSYFPRFFRPLLLVLAASLLLVSFPAAAATDLAPGGSFVDDNGSVHEGAIEAHYAARITRGCNPPANDRFCPDEPVTRGQMAAFLNRAFGYGPAGSSSSAFTDTVAHTFAADVAALAEAGITRGCNPPANDRFCPDEPVTRGQMAAFLNRAFGYGPAGSSSSAFTDTVAHTLAADVAALAEAGITRGCNPPRNDRFCPDDYVTRAEMATFLARALNLDIPEVPQPAHQLTIEPRDVWGARPARVDRLRPHTVDTLTIHHDGSPGSSFGTQRIAGFQNWHMDHHGWGDVAYHYVVGRDGTVYEGRAPSYRADTATSYDTTGHLLVVLEGHLDHYEPTNAQLDSLVKLMAYAADVYGLDPFEMKGHRHHPGANTTCPGKHLVPLIEDGSLAARAHQILASGGVSVTGP